MKIVFEISIIRLSRTVKKCVSFFYFEKCADFTKISIFEGYFMQLNPNFGMWLV